MGRSNHSTRSNHERDKKIATRAAPLTFALSNNQNGMAIVAIVLILELFCLFPCICDIITGIETKDGWNMTTKQRRNGKRRHGDDLKMTTCVHNLFAVDHDRTVLLNRNDDGNGLSYTC